MMYVPIVLLCGPGSVGLFTLPVTHEDIFLFMFLLIGFLNNTMFGFVVIILHISILVDLVLTILNFWFCRGN